MQLFLHLSIVASVINYTGTPFHLVAIKYKTPNCPPSTQQLANCTYIHKASCAICSYTWVHITSGCWQLDRVARDTTVDKQGHVQPGLESPAATKPCSNRHKLETHKNVADHGKFFSACFAGGTGCYRPYEHSGGPITMGFCQCVLS